MTNITRNPSPSGTIRHGLRKADLARYPLDVFTLIPLHKHDAERTMPNGKVLPMGKVPRDKGWQKRAYDSAAVLDECIAKGINVGVRLTDDVMVIDVDPRNGGDDGILALAHDIGIDLDAYPMVITGSNGRHIYMAKTAGAIRDTLDDESYSGVEFKSVGRQVLAAGSRHPNGKLYLWRTDGPRIEDGLKPAPRGLMKMLKRPESTSVAGGGQYTPDQIATMLSTVPPEVVSTNDKWFKVMQACHHASAGDARVEFIQWSISDPNFSGDADIIGRRWDSLHAGRNDGVTYRSLMQFISKHGDRSSIPTDRAAARDDFEGEELDEGDDLAPSIAPGVDDWMNAGLRPPSRRYAETDLPALLDFAQKCLTDADAPIYQMGGRLVHPVRADRESTDEDSVRREAGALTISELKSHRTREYLIEHVPLHKVTKDSKKIKHAASLEFATHLLARSDQWCFPNIVGVIEAPTMRRDGTILAAEGYDPQSGLLLDTGGVQFPQVKENSTREDAHQALELLKVPFANFPFVANPKGESASRSVMLSAVLTALVRRTLHSAPMHGTSAPTMGTGKTLAIDVVSMIATGRLTTAMSQGAKEEEDEKRLFSVLLQNDLILLIDNVKRPIEGDALCTVLTQSTWQSRILGENRKVSVPTNVLMMASGNNLTFKGDMTTRALLCRLDAKIEKPETRRFDVDLKTWVPEHRIELVVAGLTLLRAFVVAGRPGLDRLTPFGRFEDWSNLVRGALVWLGEPDPCNTRASIAVDDPERSDLAQLLLAIHANIGSDEFTAKSLIDLANANSDDTLIDDTLLDAMMSVVGPHPNAKSFGKYLHANHDRIIGEFRLASRYDGKNKRFIFSIKPAGA